MGVLTVEYGDNLHALDIWEDKYPSQMTLKKLKTECKSIDEALRGGLLSHGITEISGESSAGKTQLCLHLCLNVQLPFTLGGLSVSVGNIKVAVIQSVVYI
ncbi:DNA-repair protein XRCC3 [Mytilus galloprovincialis]|uniref:DNA-repair protein XRCC3 n=1 Tax=Mytilus galloprovincialis TaxID=29158 RepID=A0A8B6DGV3_MYTGA|nr:DNA-repair protein XRCC3 [Mytilus galloprovincialis]